MRRNVRLTEYDGLPSWWLIPLCVLVLLFCAVRIARADRPPPQVTCERFLYPSVKCEAKYVYPSEAHWYVFIGDVRGDYEKGIVAFLCLPDDVWARVEVHVETQVITFYGRWRAGRVEFRK